jgi:hypothetical protein
MIGDGDCGEIGGMKIGRGNRSTRRKPAPAPLCPPQIPHDWTRTTDLSWCSKEYQTSNVSCFQLITYLEC